MNMGMIQTRDQNMTLKLTWFFIDTILKILGQNIKESFKKAFALITFKVYVFHSWKLSDKEKERKRSIK